jgi:zinc protease
MHLIKKNMKRFILSFTMAIFTFSITAQVDRSVLPVPGPAPEIQLGEAESFTLENGLKVIVVQNSKLPRVTYSLILDKDPIMEGDKAGLLSFVGEMMTAGTTNRSKDQFNEEVDFLGARISATATSLSASTLTKNQEKVLELMTDVLYNAILPEDELSKLKTQSKSALALQKGDPNGISNMLTTRLVYGSEHPYGEVETEKTVDNVSVDDVRQYVETFFRPNIAYLAIVGDINLAKAKDLVYKHFADWETSEIPTFSYTFPTVPTENVVALVDRSSSQQSVINLTYPIQNSLSSEDYLANRIIGHVLGGGASSRLFMNLREDKGFTYGANASVGADKWVARFQAFSTVRGTATDSAINEMIYEIRNLRENGVTPEELEAAKANLSGAFGRSLESPSTIAAFFLNIERYNLPKDYYATYLQRLNALSLEEVNAAASRLLKPENLYITVVGNGAEIEQGLLAFGEIQRFNNIGEPERQIAMDENISVDQVLSRYFEAIGGEEKVRSIRTSKMNAVAEIQGMKLDMSYVFDEVNGLFSNKVSMMGNVASHVVVKDGQASVTGMGQSQILNEEQFESVKMSMFIFPELHFEDLGYAMEIQGIQEVEGEESYKILVSSAIGTSQVNYYSVNSGLKVKSESAENGEMIYTDYQEIEGVLYPMVMTMKSPMIPMPLESKIESIDFNVEILEDDLK